LRREEEDVAREAWEKAASTGKQDNLDLALAWHSTNANVD
jgi:hypothetical protein